MSCCADFEFRVTHRDETRLWERCAPVEGGHCGQLPLVEGCLPASLAPPDGGMGCA